VKGVALLLVIACALVAGCGAPTHRCDAPFPLVLQSYRSVSNASLVEFQSTLFNCTDAVIPLDEPCGARDGIVPRIDIANFTYVIGRNQSAVPREAYWCSIEGPDREAVPGAYIEQRYWWDGTYEPRPGERVPVAEGAYVVWVRAGDYYETRSAVAPWDADSVSPKP
jgi:hypothetical protein